MKNRLRALRAILEMFFVLSFALFLVNYFISEREYILPIILMIIYTVLIMTCTFIIYLEKIKEKENIKKEIEENIKNKAIAKIEEQIEKDGKLKNISLIDKNKLIEKEIDKIKQKTMI